MSEKTLKCNNTFAVYIVYGMIFSSVLVARLCTKHKSVSVKRKIEVNVVFEYTVENILDPYTITG